MSVNNCISAGVFFLLLFVKNLEWKFGPETAGLIFVTTIVGIIGGTCRTLPLYLAPLVAMLFPATLLLIYLLRLL